MLALGQNYEHFLYINSYTMYKIGYLILLILWKTKLRALVTLTGLYI